MTPNKALTKHNWYKNSGGLLMGYSSACSVGPAGTEQEWLQFSIKT
jgi:hypothetical protein